MGPEIISPQRHPPPQHSQELVYAPAISMLSEDLYPRKLEVIREYIQNASDAIDDWLRIRERLEDRTEAQVKISIQGRSLLIFDNGIGMGEEEIGKLNRVAYSEKKAGQEAGYKGIGRLAGIAVADKLKVSSTCYGEPKLYHFEFRAGDMRRDVSEKKKQGIQEPASIVIERHTSWGSTDIDPADHYTLVELRNIREACDELLDENRLIEYIGDIGPVEFAPDFAHGSKISEQLSQRVPDHSPKSIFLSKADGTKLRIYKPFSDSMDMAEPGFLEVRDPRDSHNLLAFCWFSGNAEQILGKLRPAGRIFEVDDGDSAELKRRFAGLVYKLFGFSIGDRSLPERTLWTTARARALWFTGEIHIIDKDVMPTTDRSNFVENAARATLFSQARKALPPTLNDLAQTISDNRKAFADSERAKREFEDLKRKLESGAIERGDLKSHREDINKCLKKLDERKCSDKEIQDFKKNVLDVGKSLVSDLNNPKKLKAGASIADLASELEMTAKARKVYQIIMETLQQHFSADKDEYHRVAEKIYKALRDRY